MGPVRGLTVVYCDVLRSPGGPGRYVDVWIAQTEAPPQEPTYVNPEAVHFRVLSGLADAFAARCRVMQLGAREPFPQLCPGATSGQKRGRNFWKRLLAKVLFWRKCRRISRDTTPTRPQQKEDILTNWLRNRAISEYLATVREGVGVSAGRLRLIRSFTPDIRMIPPPPTAKLATLTSPLPNAYLLVQFHPEDEGTDPKGCQLLVRGWVNATLGAAAAHFKRRPDTAQYDFECTLCGKSDHALRLRQGAASNPLWVVRWGPYEWQPLQVLAADSPGNPAAEIRIWLAIGIPNVDIRWLAEDERRIWAYASIMEAIRLGYEDMLGGGWVVI